MRAAKALLGAVTLTAAAVGTTVATAPPASANGPCNYVTTDTAYVRENPTINSVDRKTVPAQYAMTGPLACGGRTGWDGRTWFAVDCGCTSDGVGWVIANKAVYVPL